MQLSAKYRSTVGRILVDYSWHISQLSYNLIWEEGFSVIVAYYMYTGKSRQSPLKIATWATLLQKFE